MPRVSLLTLFVLAASAAIYIAFFKLRPELAVCFPTVLICVVFSRKVARRQHAKTLNTVIFGGLAAFATMSLLCIPFAEYYLFTELDWSLADFNGPRKRLMYFSIFAMGALVIVVYGGAALIVGCLIGLFTHAICNRKRDKG